MRVYYIQRSGIYDQGVYGIFKTKEDGLLNLKKAKAEETDDYHDLTLIEREFGVCGYDDEIPIAIIRYGIFKTKEGGP